VEEEVGTYLSGGDVITLHHVGRGWRRHYGVAMGIQMIFTERVGMSQGSIWEGAFLCWRSVDEGG